MKIFFCGLLLPFFFMACKNGQRSQTAIKSELLAGRWKVAFIETADKRASGAEMGDPIYEFADGFRYKIFETPPHRDSVRYELKNDSIAYPDNAKLPTVKISKLTKDSLVLVSEKAVWRLFK